MCHEYMWSRRRADEQARDLWRDFDRTSPVADDAREDRAPEPTRSDPSEEAHVLSADR
jgi:hypothetical protein